MEQLYLGLEIVLFAFLINFVWEVWHSELYTTCHRMTYWARIRLLTLMSLKDGFWIAALYFFTFFIFGSENILTNLDQTFLFVFLALLVGYFTEYTALKWKRWEYHSTMPMALGVGLTPLLELAVTGLLAFVLVFLI